MELEKLETIAVACTKYLLLTFWPLMKECDHISSLKRENKLQRFLVQMLRVNRNDRLIQPVPAIFDPKHVQIINLCKNRPFKTPKVILALVGNQ